MMDCGVNCKHGVVDFASSAAQIWLRTSKFALPGPRRCGLSEECLCGQFGCFREADSGGYDSTLTLETKQFAQCC